MESLSIWDQKNRKFIRRGFTAGRITAEFSRTKIIKIAEHTLAEIRFDFKKDLNDDRDIVISRDVKKVGTSGFRYENIGNVYLSDGQLLEKNTAGEYEVLAHGTPVPGELEGGNENCAVEGMKCTDGTDTNCKPGKCLIGKLKKVSAFKWKYTSEATYEGTNAEYYLGGKEQIELKTIIRGSHTNPDGTVLGIDRPASKSTTIFLPPANYFDSVFLDEFVKFFNYTLDLDGTDTFNGIVTTEEDFIRRVIELAYRNVSHLGTGPMYSSLADAALSREVYTAVEDILFHLNKVWKEKASELMSLRWDNRFAKHETNREFISYIFRDLRVLFSKCLQVTRSGLKQSRIRPISDESVRPVYFRLPATALSYRPDEQEDILVIGEENERFDISISALEVGTIVALSDRSIAYQFLPRAITDETERRSLGMSPVLSDRTKAELYSPKDEKSWYRLPTDRLPKAPVAKWILAGVDEFLREKKYNIESFYYTYLDPTECSPKNLDWLAQHVGLSAPLWNTDWDVKYKRALIKNALGWYEKSLTLFIGDKEYKTIKGEVLDSHPFNTLPWRTEETVGTEETDINDVDLSSTNSVNFSIYKAEWNGLMESKGSILSLAFLFSLFEIKGHVPSKEVIIIGNQYRIKNGLRSSEVDAPILLPVKYDFVQVGNSTDATIGAYSNQLIAGKSAVTDQENVNNIFFRLPFYYNRDGRTWDTVNSVTKYWASAKLNPRVQYAYLAANTWQVGDGFFEPEIIDESIFSTSLVLTENNEYLTTEDRTPLNYN